MLELICNNEILGRKLWHVKIQKQPSETEKVSSCRVHGQVVATLHWSMQESDPEVCSHCFHHDNKGLLYLTLFFSFPSMTLNKDWSKQDFILGVIVGKAHGILIKHWTLLLSLFSSLLVFWWIQSCSCIFFSWQKCYKISSDNLLSYVSAYPPELSVAYVARNLWF